MKIKIGNKSFEVSKEELEGNPEEITLDFNGVLRTQEEESVFVENHKKDARKEGLEIAVKQYRDEYGFEGRSIEKLIEAVEKKTLADAKIEPAEKLKKVQEKLDEKETALQNALTKVQEKENEFKTYKNETKISSTLDSLIPENVMLPREDMKLIIKNKLSFDVDENGNIIALDSMGNVIKDQTTANPRNVKDVVDNWFKDNQNYLKPIEGGSGGGDSSGKGGKKSIDDFIEQMREKDIAPNSDAFNAELNKQMEAGLIEV